MKAFVMLAGLVELPAVWAAGDSARYGLLARDVTATPTTPPGSFSYPNIPDCSKACYNETVSTDGCAISDFVCQCSESTAFQGSFESCVMQACTKDDQEAYLDGLLKECTAVGMAGPPINVTVTSVLPSPTATGSVYSAIPECSKKCFNDTVSTDGCQLNDTACHCKNTSAFDWAFSNCVVNECGVPCQQRYQAVIDAQCKSVGVDVPVVAIPLQTGFPAPGSDNCPLDAYPAIPECSQKCFNQTIATDGCCLADAACHCSKTAAFQDDFTSCVVKDCPVRKDQKAYIKALTDSCSSVCVSVPEDGRLSLPPMPSATRRVKAIKKRQATSTTVTSSTCTPSVSSPVRRHDFDSAFNEALEADPSDVNGFLVNRGVKRARAASLLNATLPYLNATGSDTVGTTLPLIVNSTNTYNTSLGGPEMTAAATLPGSGNYSASTTTTYVSASGSGATSTTLSISSSLSIGAASTFPGVTDVIAQAALVAVGWVLFVL